MDKQQSRFLTQQNYAEKKAFVLSVLNGLTFAQAISEHVRLNYNKQHDVYFSVRTFHGFLRVLKGSLLDDSRNNSEAQRLQYKKLNLYGGLAYLRDNLPTIINYIEILEKEGQHEHH